MAAYSYPKGRYERAFGAAAISSSLSLDCCPIHRAAVGAVLQPGNAGIVRHSLFLLVPDGRHHPGFALHRASLSFQKAPTRQQNKSGECEMSSQVALRNRGLIATAALLAQMCLGSVYAWSVFVKPLMASEGWSQIQVTLTFNMAMACLGIGTVIGGWWQDKVGPRIVTTFAGFIYGLGFVIAAYSIKSHWLPGVYIGYGLFSGLG